MCTLLRVRAALGFAAGLVLLPASAGAAAAAAAVPAQAAARHIGEAAVREGEGGVPCFTIAEKEERRFGAPYFQTIRVSDVSDRQAAPMWFMDMPSGRSFPLMYSMCVPYAGRAAALPQRRADALMAGRLYEVEITVRTGEGAPVTSAAPKQPTPAAAVMAAPPASYAARFCLVRQADGSTAPRQLASVARTAAACMQ